MDYQHAANHATQSPRAKIYRDFRPEWDGRRRMSLLLGERCDHFAYIEGRLDEVALYGRALSPEEVEAHFRLAGLAHETSQ